MKESGTNEMSYLWFQYIYGNSCLKCGYVKNKKIVDHQENDKNKEYDQQVKKLYKYIAVIIFLIVTLVMAIIMLQSLNKTVEKKEENNAIEEKIEGEDIFRYYYGY